MWHFRIIILLFCFFTLNALSAQEDSIENDLTLQHEKVLLRQAERNFKFGNFYDAADYYIELLRRKPDNHEFSFRIAESLMHARDYPGAAVYFEQVISSGGEAKFPLSRFYLAEMLKKQGKYEEAEKNYRCFLQNPGENTAESRSAKVALDGIQFVNNFDERVQLKYTVEPLEAGVINRPYTEFAPFVLGDSLLIFSSLNDDTILNAGFYKPGYSFSRIYRAKKTNGEWSDVEPLPYPINNYNYHSGNGTFSPDGMRFYYTQCEGAGTGMEIICYIHIADYMDGRFLNHRRISKELNDNRYLNTHPSVALHRKGQDILYFSSNRKGGFGGIDIWYSIVNFDGKASDPINLGNTINTANDEITPFYDQPNSTIYFSSTGHPGFGGFDIFRSKGNWREWSKPENAGKPLNSPADDMYYVPGENEKISYVISNRPGTLAIKGETCCDDIFRISEKELPKFHLSANVFDLERGDLLGDLTFSIIDASTGKLLAETKSQSEQQVHQLELPYQADITLRITKEGFFTESVSLSTLGLEHSMNFDVRVPLKPIEVEKAYKVEDIYYDFGSATVREESVPALDELYEMLQENPTLNVEIASHTDNVGSAAFNLKLSQERAEHVVNYLIQKGIDPSRLKAKGYGQNVPVAPNTHPDGQDNPDGRQLNRRTEFKIIKD